MFTSIHLELWSDKATEHDPPEYELVLTKTYSYVRLQVRPIERDGRKRSFNATIGPTLAESLAKYFYANAKLGGA